MKHKVQNAQYVFKLTLAWDIEQRNVTTQVTNASFFPTLIIQLSQWRRESLVYMKGSIPG